MKKFLAFLVILIVSLAVAYVSEHKPGKNENTKLKAVHHVDDLTH